MTNLEIAETILDQMGGMARLHTMIGACCATYLDGMGGVKFIFSGCRHSNKVVIKLNEFDLYDVEFWKFTRKTGDIARSSVVSNVYADQLINVFACETGLRLTL